LKNFFFAAFTRYWSETNDCEICVICKENELYDQQSSNVPYEYLTNAGEAGNG